MEVCGERMYGGCKAQPPGRDGEHLVEYAPHEEEQDGNGLYGDSASYVMGSYKQLESLLIFAITFPDPAHLLTLPIKGIFDSASSAPSIIKDFFHDVYAFVIEAHNFFKNSKQRAVLGDCAHHSRRM